MNIILPVKIKSHILFLIICLSLKISAQTSFTFDGVDDYATITKSGNTVINNFSSPHDFTIEIRFKYHMNPIGSAAVVSMHSEPADGFFIEFVPGTTTLKTGMGYNGFYTTRTSTSLVKNTWYTASFSYLHSTKTFNYYLDGVLVGTPAVMPNFSPETLYALSIGKSLRWNSPSPIDVDFFRIWTNIQTPTQINNNKLIEVACNSTNLLLQYKFDIQSTILDDCTTSNLDGSILGASQTIAPASIPTLGEWGLIILLLCMLILGVTYQKSLSKSLVSQQ